MTKNFGRGNYPVVWKSIRSNQRERFLFVVAAGLCFSLFLILIFVLNFRSDASAKEDIAPKPAAAVNPGTVTLLAPERGIRAGDLVTNVKFKEIYWPRNQVPEGAVRDFGEIQGMFAMEDIPPRVPLRKAQLTKEQSRITLPVTPGNRAVAFEVDETSGIEGHALPGTRVDIILTYQDQGELTTKIIVQNARIISRGGDTTTVSELNKTLPQGQQRRSSRTVTVDVSVNDALQINTARQLGRLGLMMRNSEDNKGVQDTEVTRNSINGPQKAAKRSNCRTGHMKVEGREFMVDCDGSLTPVSNLGEP